MFYTNLFVIVKNWKQCSYLTGKEGVTEHATPSTEGPLAPLTSPAKTVRGSTGRPVPRCILKPTASRVWGRKQKAAVRPDPHGFKSCSVLPRPGGPGSISMSIHAKWVEILSRLGSQRSYMGPDTQEPASAEGHPNSVLQSEDFR